MTRLLPPVLSRFDLPEVELQAAALDGELFAVDECFSPIDASAHAEGRGFALGVIIPPRLIAEQRSAAWVLGALDSPPLQHQLCADSAARYRCLGVPRLTVREVILDERDTLLVGGIRVTTPLRTAIDLARFSARFDDEERMLVTRLAELGGFGVAEPLGDLDRRPHLPGKARAVARLREALA